MAIFHVSVKIISRSTGRSAVAAAAYRSASRLHDEPLDRDHDFSNKSGVVHSEVMLPAGAPEALLDRAVLWNAVEAVEKRRDAQLAREVEFAIPREMNQAQGVALARDFVAEQFVARGMVADLNVHWDVGADGNPKPHAHVMLALRSVGPEGFGAKERAWNATSMIEHWREAWASHVNVRLAELDIDARIDHRSFEAQGIALEPQPKLGPAAARRLERGQESERADELRAIAARNGDRIIADPRLALDAITHAQATFTRRDLAMFLHRHSEGQAQFDAAMASLRGSPEMVALGKDGRGEERFTARAMIEAERKLDIAADKLSGARDHGLPANAIERAQVVAAQSNALVLGTEQQAALERIAQPDGLSIILGYAGTGKSAMLGVARNAWEQAGYRVHGLALSGIAAENLEKGSGIASRTIAGAEHQWAQGRELPSSRDILVVDEAGMVGTRQMERLLSQASAAGAKVVLVGDPEQLQAIEAGAAFRMLAERHGAVEIGEVRRQREAWQRDATRWLATGRTAQALHAYEEHGHVHGSDTREEARAHLIGRWTEGREAQPGASRIILTHINDEVRALNALARERLRDVGALGDDVSVKTVRGTRDFAPGDRLLFLRNERDLGVKNGTLGTLLDVTPAHLSVRLDDGREVSFDTKAYADVDHGYAVTIHKAQGMTVDHAHVLATPGLDRHASYVALTRHRDGVALHYGRDDFADMGRLVRTLSRERAKDMAADYLAPEQRGEHVRAFAERRGFARIVEQVRDIFAGFRAKPLEAFPSEAQPVQAAGIEHLAERYARSHSDIRRMTDVGLEPRVDQMRALDRARDALDTIRPHAAADLERALERCPPPAGMDASGRSLVQAMREEQQLRTDPFRRADRFIEGWQQLQSDRAQLERDGDARALHKVEERMTHMARDLKADWQVAALLLGGERADRIDVDQVRAFEHGAPERAAPERNRGMDR
jgi:Ti-type conjugative transfer relaxase TraA